MLWVVVLIIAAYLLGAVPFGLIIGKGVRGIDIREVGSGNIGTANAIRALGPFWGGVVFLCDALKGVLPVVAAVWIPGAISPAVQPCAQVFAGLASIVGHNYPIFLKFKGGKGIATSFGVFLALSWKAALLAFLVYIIVVLVSKYSSLGSLMGALAVPILMWLFRSPPVHVVFAVLAATLAFYMHRANIRRLLRGEERKITEKVAPELKK